MNINSVAQMLTGNDSTSPMFPLPWTIPDKGEHPLSKFSRLRCFYPALPRKQPFRLAPVRRPVLFQPFLDKWNQDTNFLYYRGFVQDRV